MPQKTPELVGIAVGHAAGPGVHQHDDLYGLGKRVDLRRGPALTRAWAKDRRMVALINRYQADLKRDPGPALPRKNRINRKKAPQCAS